MRLPRPTPNVGVASDLYAVGAVAYFLLTGATAFEGRTFAEICEHHLHSQPTPPSLRVPYLAPALDALVLACLEKQPSARPASALALRDALMALALPACTAAADRWWRMFRARPALRRPATVDPVGQTLAVADR